MWGLQFCIVEFSKLNLPFSSVDLYAARSLQTEFISVLISLLLVTPYTLINYSVFVYICMFLLCEQLIEMLPGRFAEICHMIVDDILVI